MAIAPRPWPALAAAAACAALVALPRPAAPASAPGRSRVLVLVAPELPGDLEAALAAALERDPTVSAARGDPGKAFAVEARTVAGATAAARLEALETARRAEALYGEAKLDEGIDLLLTAERKLAEPLAAAGAFDRIASLRFWLGVCLAKKDDREAALGHLDFAAAAGAPAPDAARFPPEVVDVHRAALAAPRREVTISGWPEGAALRLDGRPVAAGRVDVGPGEHLVTASLLGFATAVRRLPADASSVEIRLEPATRAEAAAQLAALTTPWRPPAHPDLARLVAFVFDTGLIVGVEAEAAAASGEPCGRALLLDGRTGREIARGAAPVCAAGRPLDALAAALLASVGLPAATARAASSAPAPTAATTRPGDPAAEAAARKAARRRLRGWLIGAGVAAAAILAIGLGAWAGTRPDTFRIIVTTGSIVH